MSTLLPLQRRCSRRLVRSFNFTPTSALRYDTSVSLRDATFDGSGFVLDVVPSSPAHWSAEVARLKVGCAHRPAQRCGSSRV